MHSAVIALGTLVLAGAVSAQTAPSLQVGSVGELLVDLEITAGAGDVQLQSSPDAEDWSDGELYVPAGRTLHFPLPKPDPGMGFFRLVEVPSEPLEADVPDLSGMTLGVIGGAVYEFRADGSTGLLALVQGAGSPTAFYDFTWSVLESQPGLTTVRTESADGYLEVLNFQFLEVGQIAVSITSSEGPGGNSFFVLTPFTPLPDPPELGGAPATLEGTSWQLTPEDQTGVTANFTGSGTATGPNLVTGAMTTWTYDYIPTGSNTATLAVTDADGNFGRFFLIFELSGDLASFGFSSGIVDGLFGDDETMGAFALE